MKKAGVKETVGLISTLYVQKGRTYSYDKGRLCI